MAVNVIMNVGMYSLLQSVLEEDAVYILDDSSSFLYLKTLQNWDKTILILYRHVYSLF